VKPTTTASKIKSKGHRLLPGRAAVNDIAGSGQSLTDYSKASPLTPSDTDPSLIAQYLTGRRGKK